MSASNAASTAQIVLQRLATAVQNCSAELVSGAILGEIDDLATKHNAKEQPDGKDSTDPAQGLRDAVLLTTNPGLELEVRREVVDVCGECNAIVPSPFGCPGFVLVSGASMDSLLTLRSVHEILNYEGHFTVPAKEEGAGDSKNGAKEGQKEGGEPPEELVYIREQMKGFDLKGMKDAASFRVTSSCSGAQSFKSNECEREVGSVVHEKYKMKADMKNFDVAVRVDVCMRHVLVSTSPNRSLLSKRHKLAFTRTVTLKPNVAFCMIQMCEPKKQGFSLLDPFCGGGTVLLEAAEMFGDKAGKLFGCDRSDAAVKGSQANAKAAGNDKIEFQQMNAQAVDRKFAPDTFDAVVTNPPWGIRLSSDADLTKIYRGFLYAVSKVVKKGGRVVVMVQRCELVLDAIRRTGLYNILRVCAVKTGEQIPSIFVLENKGVDVMRLDLKAQIRNIAPLVAYKYKDAEKDTQFEDAVILDAPKPEDEQEGGGGAGKKRKKAKGNDDAMLEQ